MNITRRSAMTRGAQAVAAGAVFPFIPATAQADDHLPRTDDSDLYSAYRAYLKTGKKEDLDWFWRSAALTPDGMILKVTFGWSDSMWRDWRINGQAADVKFHPAVCPSVLMDLERWIGRRST